MDAEYWIVDSALNTIREILRNVLNTEMYEEENKRLQDAKEWLYKLAADDYCKNKDTE